MIRQIGPVIALLVVTLFAYKVVDGAEPVKEMVMPTEVGEIVLTVEECPVKNQHGFDYYGYATDPGNPAHPGCWNADDSVVQIWFVNENVVGVYKKELFKPRTQV